MSSPSGPVLLYDGLCGFCDRTVRWVLRFDRLGVFCFAPLQGDLAAEVVARHPELRDIDSLVLVEEMGGEGERIAVRSSAVLGIARVLSGAWKLLLVFAVIPSPLRDWAYDVFARHRYRVFGRYDACPPPPPEVGGRFLE